MAVFPLLLLILMVPSSSNAQRPPSPGYWPSSRFRSMNFYQGYRNLWGYSHQRAEQNALTIWLDSTSGSGFKSVKPFRSGYFGASIKLQPGYTAGVITAFYLSNSEAHPGYHDEVDIEFLGTTFGKPYTLQTNDYIRGSGDGRILIFVITQRQLSNSEAHPGYHDEVDIEFLGTTFGKPYTLQTNDYIRGSGDGRIIGREMKFHLWFDPTKTFHRYAILWSPKEIIFLVDDVPIRRYPMKSATTFPLRPMWVYGSIWDASSWATEDGKYRADYRYQPFVARYTNFKASGCSAYSPAWCLPESISPFRSGGLTKQQSRSMRWVQRYRMVYDYCKDYRRDHSLTPECWG